MKPSEQVIAAHFSRLRIAHVIHSDEVARSQLQDEMRALRAANPWLSALFAPMGWE